jgi:hypothetical protein
VSAGLRRYHERRRQLAEVKPRDLARLERTGVVARSLRPLIGIAAEEAEGLTIALGGPDRITPQQRILVEDLCAVGITLRACMALFLKEPDPDIASKIGTLAGARRSSLALLGLSRCENEVPDLSTYLREKALENAASDANSDDPEHRPVDTLRDVSTATRSGVLGGGTRPPPLATAPNDSSNDPPNSGE